MISKRLSLWWTHGERDDIFWRTPQSGGRATERGKKNKGTSGQYGDIQATDSIGQPLLKVCTIELKTGYARAGMEDLMDRLEKKNIRSSPTYEKFLLQAIEESKLADTPWWLLITRRKNKSVMVYMPWGLWSDLMIKGMEEILSPRIKMTVVIKGPRRLAIFGTTLDEFLSRSGGVKAFKRLAKKLS